MNQSHAVVDPEHAGKLLEQELGGLIGARRNIAGRAEKGNRNSAIYADEKSDIPIVPKKLPNKGCMLPGGGDGGKGDSRREGRREPRMPDTEPGKCVEGTRRHTRTRHAIHRNAFASLPEAGAVCGSSARTDLCGGRRVTVVPTATTMVFLHANPFPSGGRALHRPPFRYQGAPEAKQRMVRSAG